MSANSDPASPPPEPALSPSLAGALQGLWRLTWRRRLGWRQTPALLGSVLAIPLLACLTAFNRPEHKASFFYWVVVFYLQAALPLYCLALLGDLIRGELQANTLVFLATRPLTRARLFLVKFLCEMVWIQILAAVSTLLLIVLGLMLGIPQILVMAPLLLGIQILAVWAYGALSALFGMLHRRFLVVGAIYGLVVEVGIGQIPTNINNLSINRHIRTLLGNIQAFRDAYDLSAEGSWKSVLILLTASAILASAAAALLTWREYHYNEEMHK